MSQNTKQSWLPIAALSILLASALTMQAQSPSWQPDLTEQQTYTVHRASSADPTGANHDYRTVAPGDTITVLDTDGPARSPMSGSPSPIRSLTT